MESVAGGVKTNPGVVILSQSCTGCHLCVFNSEALHCVSWKVLFVIALCFTVLSFYNIVVASVSYKDGVLLWTDLVFKGAVASTADEQRSLKWLTESFVRAEWAVSLLLLNLADENVIVDWALRMQEQMVHLFYKTTTLTAIFTWSETGWSFFINSKNFTDWIRHDWNERRFFSFDWEC